MKLTDKQIEKAKEVPITDILDRINIPYETAGDTAKIPCPFHIERNASMVIYNDGFFCFGCNEKGDAIDMIRKLLGLSFIDAVEMLNLIVNEK